MTVTTSFNTPSRFQVVVLWHPEFVDGGKISDDLFRTFGRDLRRGIADGMHIDILLRSKPQRGGILPLPVPLSPETCTAVVALVDENMCDAEKWCADYVAPLFQEIQATRGASRFYVVPFTKRSLPVEGINNRNHVRFDFDYSSGRYDISKLHMELCLDFCSLLIPWVRRLEAGEPLPPRNETKIEPVHIFISHAKHDGLEHAKSVQNYITGSTRLNSFFDAHDLRSDEDFSKELIKAVGNSAVLAIRTNAFSSREWCRREIITAKQYLVPLVVLDAVTEAEDRSMAYLGNTPVIRCKPSLSGAKGVLSIQQAIYRLLFEVLRDLHWKANTDRLSEMVKQAMDCTPTLMLSREPELATLVPKPSNGVILYPDPPLGDGERKLMQSFLGSETNLITPSTLVLQERS